MRACCPIWMTIPVRRSARKPGARTSTVYSPGTRYRTSYLPSAPVCTVRTSPVAGCVIVSGAPATTAPVGSSTVPRMPVSSVWARRGASSIRVNRNTRRQSEASLGRCMGDSLSPPQDRPRPGAGMPAVFCDYRSVDQHVFDPDGELLRVFEGGAIRNPLRVENHEVGFHPGPQQATVQEPEGLGGQRGHLADRFGK